MRLLSKHRNESFMLRSPNRGLRGMDKHIFFHFREYSLNYSISRGPSIRDGWSRVWESVEDIVAVTRRCRVFKIMVMLDGMKAAL